ncbi:MAG TPA: diguanylate cyclase, partial [Acidimicrobiales bacterium]|nr:diguanylate cyclase [Acidimicrobiales bacterium]
PSCAQVTGYTPEQLLGTDGWAYIHPDDRRADAPLMIEGLGKGPSASFKFEWRLRHADGEYHWYDLTITDMADDPSVGGVVGNLRDITEERTAQHLLAERELQLRMALDSAQLATWEMDVATGQTTSSDNAGALLGIGPNQTLRDIVHPEDRFMFERAARSATTGGEAFVIDFRVLAADGTTRWIHGRGKILPDPSGIPKRMIGAVMDVTTQKAAEVALVETSTSLRQTLEAAHDAFVGTDENGIVTDWNSAAEEMFGWKATEVLGQPFAGLVWPEMGIGRSSAPTCLLEMANTARQTERGAQGLVELVLADRSGRTFPVELSLVSIEQQGHKLVKAFIRDIEHRKALERELTNQAVTDPLTGLPNRTLLRDRLDVAVARLDRTPGLVAVMFLDLDRFKVVNDSLGHAAGDKLLVEMARRIKSVVRKGDTVARFGGDEFVIVTEPLREREDASRLAQRILRVLAAPVDLGSGHELHPSVSLGISMTATSDARADDLLRDADVAMYRAKERGGERIEIFDSSMRSRAIARLEVEADLRHAIESEELFLNYQPVVSFEGHIVGVEALVRWRHPVKGVVPPMDFVPLAEETGL